MLKSIQIPIRRIVISTIVVIATITNSSHSGSAQTFKSVAECHKYGQALLRTGRLSWYQCVPISGPSTTKAINRKLKEAVLPVPPKGWHREHLKPNKMVKKHPLMKEARMRNLYGLDRLSNTQQKARRLQPGEKVLVPWAKTSEAKPPAQSPRTSFPQLDDSKGSGKQSPWNPRADSAPAPQPGGPGNGNQSPWKPPTGGGGRPPQGPLFHVQTRPEKGRPAFYYDLSSKSTAELATTWGNPSATKLAQNLIEKGIKPPALMSSLPTGFTVTAHHIVPGTQYVVAPFKKGLDPHVLNADPNAIAARTHLANLGFNSNDAANGVFLVHRTNKKATIPSGIPLLHNQIHTSKYFAEVYRRLMPTRSVAEAKDVLQEIARELQQGKFPF